MLLSIAQGPWVEGSGRRPPSSLVVQSQLVEVAKEYELEESEALIETQP